MIDIVTYLESKDLEVKVANQNNIHVRCFFCNENDEGRGRLYVCVDPTVEPYGMFLCFLCGHKGTFNTILRHFGDKPVDNASGKQDDDSLPDDEFCAILNCATDYYHDRLLENQEAYQYLTFERGFTEQTIRKFRFGWADGQLITHLVQKGFGVEAIARTGLVNRFGSDFLVGKITIPYVVCGQVVCIRGKEIGGKYLTPPGQKARLYNIDSLLSLNADSRAATRAAGAEISAASGETVVEIPNPDVLSSSEKIIKPKRKFAVGCEGEFDTATLDQLGFVAFGVPGANTWQDNWGGYLEAAQRIYLCFDTDDAGKAGAEKVSTKLGPKARIVELPKAMPGQRKIDVNSWVADHGAKKEDFEFLFSKAKGGLLVTVRESYARWQEVEGNPDLKGLRFNIPDLDSQMRHGLLPAQVVTAIAKTGSGKHHPLGTPVPTPDGIRRWGDLMVGDLVYGSDGRPTKVTQIFDRGVLPSYRVSFSDGTSILAGLDHIWTVEYRSTDRKRSWKRKNLTTEEIIQQGLKYRKEWRFRIPLTQPVEYSIKDLPIGPYTMGAMIANAYMTGTPVVRTPDPDVVERMRQEGSDVRAHKVFGCPGYGINGIRPIVQNLGLEVRSAGKFIPEIYQLASIEQRVQLLRGLMDGDGSNPTKRSQYKRHVAYHTTSIQLAHDVARLVNSLGGTGKINSLTRAKRDDSGDSYEDIIVSIMLPIEILSVLFTERKNSSFEYTNLHVPHRAIVDISYESDDDCRCITVAAQDSLYSIGENYIVTHNTILTINLFQRMAMIKPDIKILFVSLEQTRNEWYERAHRINSFYNPYATHEDTVRYWEDKLLIVDKNRITQKQLEACVDQYEYEMGDPPDITAVDYLGYYARGFKGDEYARVTEAIMGMKEMAKDKLSVFFTPSQVNRTGTFGKALAADQAKSSGGVEETSDMLISIVNPDQRVDVRPEDQTKEVDLQILKSRDGGVGQLAKLQFCPLTLALVPVQDPLYARALSEKKYASHGDTFEDVIHRYKTGDESIYTGRR